MSTYVIGDIQGCYRTLQVLLQKLQFKPESDTLWFVGDLVNRGPSSLEVLDFVMGLHPDRVRFVLGNHDLHLLAVLYGCQSVNKLDTFDTIINAPHSHQIAEWLRQQPLIYFDPDINVVLTHAGIYPLWTLSEAIQNAEEVCALLQSDRVSALLATMYGNHPEFWHPDAAEMDRARFIINAFTRMRLLTADGGLELTTKESLEKIPDGLVPWFQYPHRNTIPAKIIFGHWAALKGRVSDPNIFGLDTGCVWGGELTALDLGSWQKISVENQE